VAGADEPGKAWAPNENIVPMTLQTKIDAIFDMNPFPLHSPIVGKATFTEFAANCPAGEPPYLKFSDSTDL
jgi:hypothetical protein